MISYVSKAQSAVEELKVSLEANTLEGIKTKLDNFYMVLVLREMRSDFEHVRDQTLTGHKIPSMEIWLLDFFEFLHQNQVVVQVSQLNLLQWCPVVEDEEVVEIGGGKGEVEEVVTLNVHLAKGWAILKNMLLSLWVRRKICEYL